MRSKYDNFRDTDMTLGEIAEELGVSKEAARNGFRRAGIKPNKEMLQTIIQRASGMKPTEAVHYLIEMVQIIDSVYFGDDRHPVDDLPIKFTPAQRDIMILLLDNAGKMVSKDRIHSVLLLRRENTMIRTVDAHICKLRKKIPEEMGMIENIYGYGFRLELKG